MQLYHSLAVIYGHDFLEKALALWEIETDYLAKGSLTGSIGDLMKEKDAPRVWSAVRGTGTFYGRCELLRKLSRYQDIKSEVVAEILRDLNKPSAGPSEWFEYSKVRDPLIDEWFLAQSEASDPRLRELARLRRALKTPRPHWLRTASKRSVPVGRESYSAEFDIADLPHQLEWISQEYSLEIKDVESLTRFLLPVRRGRWFTGCLTGSGGMYQLWIGKEDSDVVELYITRGLA